MFGKMITGISFLLQIIVAGVFCFSEAAIPQAAYIIIWGICMVPGMIGLRFF